MAAGSLNLIGPWATVGGDYAGYDGSSNVVATTDQTAWTGGSTIACTASIGGTALTVGTNANLETCGWGTIGGTAMIVEAHSRGNMPGIETFASSVTYSGGRVRVAPELPEQFAEQMSPNALEVVPNELLQLEFLAVGEFLTPLEQAPSRLGQDWLVAVVP